MDDGLGLYATVDREGIVWDVYEESAGRWRWRYYDKKKGHVVEESKRVFRSAEETKVAVQARGMCEEFVLLFRSTSSV